MPSIRTARTADLWAILEIYNDAILNTAAVYDYTPRTLELCQAWFDEKQRIGWLVLVAEAEGEPGVGS